MATLTPAGQVTRSWSRLTAKRSLAKRRSERERLGPAARLDAVSGEVVQELPGAIGGVAVDDRVIGFGILRLIGGSFGGNDGLGLDYFRLQARRLVLVAERT